MERMVMDLMRIGWAAFFVSANLCVQTISCASLTIPDPSSNVIFNYRWPQTYAPSFPPKKTSLPTDRPERSAIFPLCHHRR